MARAAPRVFPGEPYPRGAIWDGRGVNFAVFSRHAEKVELCLFDVDGQHETYRIPMPEYTDEIWHCYLPDVRPGQLYGYRVYGPYAPDAGHRFNHHKLLIDPYARAIEGALKWTDAHYGYRIGDPRGDLSFDTRDNARYMPKCRVVDSAYTWGEDARPRTAWERTIVYETHVRGFTMRHPDVPGAARGTFAGMSHSSVIRYLRDLGVTAVEFLPVHAFVDDHRLINLGLFNYWGYNTLCFFAPQPRYLMSKNINEFKTLVQHLHDAGIEVLLDVVYNHTAEGNHLGPTLCFRGIDNAAYYRLMPDNPRYYMDTTGCGNTLDLRHPRVLQLVMDSMRYWVEEMHVDGFRLDLTTSLARSDHGFDSHSGFLDAVQQDPVLSRVKMIAEPWDVGMGGYQLGNFPPGWAEWNDKYRDTVRRFWRGDEGRVPDLAFRLAGSSDLFRGAGRRPWASVNFVTAHDGFTLADVVSYNQKHNEANGEDNRDGTDANWSYNHGVEGPTADPKILAARARTRRNLLATLLLSQGTPMICAGDEFGRTQGGNNNAYCQDNNIGWVDWRFVVDEHDFLQFARKLIAFRKDHIVFHRARFFQGQPQAAALKDIAWLRPDGNEMSDVDWSRPYARSLSFLLSGEAGGYHINRMGEDEPDDTFFVVLNAHTERMDWVLPKIASGAMWDLVLDSSRDDALPGERIAVYEGGAKIVVPASAMLLLVAREKETAAASTEDASI